MKRRLEPDSIVPELRARLHERLWQLASNDPDMAKALVSRASFDAFYRENAALVRNTHPVARPPDPIAMAKLLEFPEGAAFVNSLQYVDFATFHARLVLCALETVAYIKARRPDNVILMCKWYQSRGPSGRLVRTSMLWITLLIWAHMGQHVDYVCSDIHVAKQLATMAPAQALILYPDDAIYSGQQIVNELDLSTTPIGSWLRDDAHRVEIALVVPYISGDYDFERWRGFTLRASPVASRIIATLGIPPPGVLLSDDERRLLGSRAALMNYRFWFDHRIPDRASVATDLLLAYPFASGDKKLPLMLNAHAPRFGEMGHVLPLTWHGLHFNPSSSVYWLASLVQ